MNAETAAALGRWFEAPRIALEAARYRDEGD